MPNKRNAVLVALVLLGALALLAMTGFLAKELLGSRSRGAADRVTDVPHFGRRLETLRAKGPVHYDIYRQWGRHIVFISGTTTLQNAEEFAKGAGMTFVLHGEMDTDLVHMAKTSEVNPEAIVTNFSETDAYALAKGNSLGRYVYLRFRHADGRFTLLFFN